MLHKLKIWPETKIWIWAHINELHELIFGGESLFDPRKDPAKCKLIWICLEYSSFTKFLPGQKLWKIAEKYLLGKLSRILAWANDMDRKRFPKWWGVNRRNINDTSFTKCYLGHNRKSIIGGFFLNKAIKSFAIFDQDMTQTIYENYLGIFWVMEI